jgi:succinate dehydrogenase / fumarate reductase cytochrome b subunit
MRTMMPWLKNTVGKKLVMAVTGFGTVGFVVVHLLGNSSVFIGPDGINAYAAKLHSLGPLVWLFRLMMIVLFSFHVFFGVQLTLENNRAKPDSYTVKRSLKATFAGKSMIWTGAIIGAFLIYHLLQFTFQVTNPEISAARNFDAAGRPDVFRMVVLSLQNFTISLLYVIGMGALVLHLTHGIQSFFQTFGLNNDRTLPVISRAGMVMALIIFLGYISIPLVIFLRIVKG